MSAITTDALARDWARRLEDSEKKRAGVPLNAARERVARRIGVAPGTLERLRRDRLKGVREWVYSRLHAAVVAETQREIAAHTHELEKLRQMGRPFADPQVQASVAGVAALIERLTKPERETL